jgi:hypothetical protein
MISHCIHIDDRGKVLCEITCDEQKLFLPIEKVGDFAVNLFNWTKEVYPDAKYKNISGFTSKVGNSVIIETKTDDSKE